MTDNITSYSLICTVREGNLKEQAKKLITSFGLSHSEGEEYVLLCDAIENKQTAIVKLLLTNGSKVNSKNKKLYDTPLHFAINGDIEIVKMLLDKGADIDAKDEYGRTLLYNAIEKKKMTITKLLLNRGANVNAKNNDGKTPLHIAAERRYLQIEYLLERHKAHVNYTYKKDYTPLYRAVGKGRERIVMMLLDRGANIDAKDEYGRTPLHNAIENENMEITELLLDFGANVDAQDNDGKTILHLAVEKGHLVIIEHILKYCPDINNKSNRSSLNAAVYGCKEKYNRNSIIVENLLRYGFTVNPEDVNNYKLLHAAVEKGYLKIVEELLKYGTDVNMLYDSTSRKGHTLLHTAIKNNQEEVAKLLISFKADVNAKDKTGKSPIFYVTGNTDLKIIKLLLTNKANVKDNPNLLNIAVKKECRETVEVLLQHGADINASDEYGRTALHFTALSKDERYFRFLFNKDSDVNVKERYHVKSEIAKILLSRGANVNARTKKGITTLHAAAHEGYMKVVEALLEHNADVNSVIESSDRTLYYFSAQKGNDISSKMLLNKRANVNAKQIAGKTALHIATQKGYKKIVEVLLKCGAKVDSKAESDITPLHIAAQEGYQEIVEVLVKFGANIDSRDKYDRTALHIASKEGRIETVVALLKHGSDINIINKNNDTPLDVAIASIGLFPNRIEVYSHDFNNDYYDFNRGICAYEQIAKILNRHIVKMKTAHLYVNKKNLLSMSSNYQIRDFPDKCEEELALMKSEKISNTNISFYDILTKGTNSLAIYMKNENIVQVLKSDEYKIKFPIYASMIENHFRKGMKRNELLEQGNITFHFLFNNSFELPYYCIENIFSYLSDEDLRILIDA